ncbi:substrate-binding domain-containing protein [Hydrocarboniphaga sp.]|uniref:substrate-binding domain-containing protein n=1 Tax=Hydrocarboniphaga sp. TaxID=2033016 RepID=UPI003D0F57FF
MTKINFKRCALAVVAAASFSPIAMADIGGGGATLPAKGYQGASASSTATGPRLSSPVPGSLFYEALPLVTQSYCQTGSGGGRSVLIGSNGNTNASRPCPATFTDAFVNGTSGFSAPSTDADFAASDAPASPGDFDAFVTNKAAHEQLVQFPAVAGTVAVIANPPGTSVDTPYFTEAELCNIFAGKITNWNQLANKSGSPYSSTLITIVYRSDSSGTTFGFSNHLNKVCQDASLAQTLSPLATALPFTPASANFSVQSVFASAFPGGVVPAHVIAASGNPGVTSAVEATNGAIGYAEMANVLSLAKPNNVIPVRVAAVDTVAELNPRDSAPKARTQSLYRSAANPTNSFTIPTTFTDVDGSVLSGTYTGRALQGNNATYGRPTGVPTALNTTQAPHPNCVALVHPGAYATSAYNTAGTPSSGYKSYPIVAVSYLLGNFALNGDANDMATLLGSPYNVALRVANGGPVTTIGSNTGYYYLTSPVVATTLTNSSVTINQARVDACIN